MYEIWLLSVWDMHCMRYDASPFSLRSNFLSKRDLANFGAKIQSIWKVPGSIFRLYVWRKRRGMYRLASGWLHPKPICNKRCQLWKWKRRHDMKKKSQWMQKKSSSSIALVVIALESMLIAKAAAAVKKNRARKDIGIRIKNISDTHKFYILHWSNYTKI